MTRLRAQACRSMTLRKKNSRNSYFKTNVVRTTTRNFAARKIAALLTRCCAAHSILFFQQMFFFLHLRPLVGVGRRGLALDDRLPHFRKLGVARREFLLRIGHVVL